MLRAALAQAQVDLDKTYVRAGVSGRVEQFSLRPGDIVNPVMRPAGILIPDGAGQNVLSAGFGQIEAQVMKVGMVAEATCIFETMDRHSYGDYQRAELHRGGSDLVRPSCSSMRNSRSCDRARSLFSWSRSTKVGWRA